jgi:hypothetical protein
MTPPSPWSREETSLGRIRHFLRDFTASAVKEHLRSELAASGGAPELTKNEIELVRFTVKGRSTGTATS